MGKEAYTLYKVDEAGRVRELTIERENNAYRTTSGLVDGKKVTSQWKYAAGVNKGKANELFPEEHAKRIVKSSLKVYEEVQGYCRSIEEAKNNRHRFQCMLASKWDSVKDKTVVDEEHPIYIQRKLDGCRNIDSAERMQTRTGKTWISAPHIQRKLKKLFEKYPNLVLDGELYNHGLNEDFNKIISLIKKSKPTEDDLKESEDLVQYWIYDLPSCPGTFSERYAELERLFKENPDILDRSFVLVEAFKVTNKDEVQDYLERFVSEGYEGAIVRLDAEYEQKRSKNLLKVKQFQDEEFPIIGIEEGKGNLSGKAGKIIVDVNGVTVAAGLRFSHEEAQEIWEKRDQLIGKTATIKYFNKTSDGSLRFPKCVQIAREIYE